MFSQWGTRNSGLITMFFYNSDVTSGNICAGSFESEYPIRGSPVRKHQIRCSSPGMHNENLVRMDLLRRHHTASLHIKLFIELSTFLIFFLRKKKSNFVESFKRSESLYENSMVFLIYIINFIKYLSSLLKLSKLLFIRKIKIIL